MFGLILAMVVSGIMFVGSVIAIINFIQLQLKHQLTKSKISAGFAFLSMYDFLCRNMLDVHKMPSYNTGYVTGWMAGLFEKSQQATAQFTHATVEVVP